MIFRDEEPPKVEEDTGPLEAYPKQPIKTRGLEMEYLYEPKTRRYLAIYKGAQSAAFRQRGWKVISKERYEARA